MIGRFLVDLAIGKIVDLGGGYFFAKAKKWLMGNKPCYVCKQKRRDTFPVFYKGEGVDGHILICPECKRKDANGEKYMPSLLDMFVGEDPDAQKARSQAMRNLNRTGASWKEK